MTDAQRKPHKAPVQVSFEFFPPKTPEMEVTLWLAIQNLISQKACQVIRLALQVGQKSCRIRLVLQRNCRQVQRRDPAIRSFHQRLDRFRR